MERKIIGYIYEVPIEEINKATYNPPTRIQGKALAPLLKSISELDIITPLIIDHESNLIDGHRRLKSAQQLGKTTVPCIIAKGNRDKLFTAVNNTTRKLSSNEGLYLELSNIFTDEKQHGLFEIYQLLLGRDVLENVWQRGGTLGGLSLNAQTIKATLGDDISNNLLANALMWVIRHSLSFQIRVWKTLNGSKETMLDCIKEDKPLPI
jgi:hypothetical protein